MKTILLSALAVAAVAGAALPASAQSWDYRDRGGWDQPDRGHWDNGPDRGQRLAWRIDQSERDGMLNRWEARRLRWELRSVQDLQYRYMRDGMQGWERADLDRRYDSLSQRLRYARGDGDYGPPPYYR